MLLFGMVLGLSYTLLWASSAIVIVGIVLEELALFADFLRLISELKRNGWRSAVARVRAKSLIGVLEKVGFTLLILGLAGELILQAHVEIRDVGLQTESQTKIAALQAETKTAESRVVAANAEAKQAQLADDQLKATVIWRQITPKQCTNITGGLYEGAGSVLVEFPMGDPEAMTFGRALEKCFLYTARWRVAWKALSLTFPIPELMVLGPDAPSAAVVSSGFMQAGFSLAPPDESIDKKVSVAIVMTGLVPGTETVEIIIGSRPIY